MRTREPLNSAQDACSYFLPTSGCESEPRYFGLAAVLTIRVIKQTFSFILFSLPHPHPLPGELCSRS